MPKWGPADVLYLMGGRDVTGDKVQAIRFKDTAHQQRSDGLGDTWETHAPTGLRTIELVQEGAFFDTASGRLHSHMPGAVTTSATPQSSVRVVCIGFAGQTAGNHAVGFEGDYNESYEVLSERGGLTKANVTHGITGRINHGVILQPLAAQTADWDTESSGIDNSASSANGGAGYLQVTAFSGFTGFVGTVRDSADDITYGDLVAFTNVTSAPAAERVTVAGTVERYLAFEGDVTGTGSITVFAMFSRH